MAHTYLSLGTNLGNKKTNLETAISLISETIGEVVSVSSFYHSAPWGFESEHDFLNVAVAVETKLSPAELLKKTQEIEQKMGRKIKSKNGNYTDRIIDIDIIFYDDLIIDMPELKIPHPLWKERDFVRIPIVEIKVYSTASAE